MAINASRRMNEELEQGIIDGRYMQLEPGWGPVPTANPPVERLSWPTYKRVEAHRESTFMPHVEQYESNAAADELAGPYGLGPRTSGCGCNG